MNKVLLAAVLSTLVTSSTEGQFLKRVGPLVRDTSYQYSSPSNDWDWRARGLSLGQWGYVDYCCVGQYIDSIRFVGLQWNLPDSLLLNETPIDSVQFTLVVSDYEPDGYPLTFDLRRIDCDLNETGAQNVWYAAFSSTEEVSFQVTHASDSVSIVSRSGGLVDMVRHALAEDRITLSLMPTSGATLGFRMQRVALTIWYDTVLVSVIARTMSDQFVACSLYFFAGGQWAEIAGGAGHALWPAYQGRSEMFLSDPTRLGVPGDTVSFYRWEVRDGGTPHDSLCSSLNATPLPMVGGREFLARHAPIASATLESRLLETWARGDSMQFRDPWYRELLDAPFNKGPSAVLWTLPVHDLNLGRVYYSAREGVLLNVGRLVRPFLGYSAKAPSPRVFGGRQGNFGFWQGNADSVELISPALDTTEIVFKLKRAVVTAVYKGPLISTSPGASGPSSQRKVVTRGSDAHLVYVSGGIVWYSKNSGEGWTPERPLSSVDAVAVNPSVAAKSSGTGEYHVYAVWEQRLSSDTTKSKVLCSYSLNGGLTWAPSLVLDDEAAYPATPVVTGQITPVVVWKGYGTGLKMRLEPWRTPSWQVYSVVGTDATTRGFAAAEPFQSSGRTHGISYVKGPLEDGDVWISSFAVVPVIQPDPTSWEVTCLTNAYPWMTGCGSTTIATDQSGTALAVAWDARGMGALSETGTDTTLEVEGVDRRVFFRTRGTSGWGPLTYLEYTYRSLAASIGYDWDALLQGSRLNVLWQDYYGNAVSHTVGSPGFFNLGPGRSPGRVEYTSTGLPWRLWMATGAAPHPLVLTQPEGPIFEEGVEHRTRISARRSRVAVVCLDSIGIPGASPGALSGYVQVHVAGPALKSGALVQGIPFGAAGSGEGRWLRTIASRVPITADSLLVSATLESREVVVNEEEVPLETPFLVLALVEGGTTLASRTLTLGALRDWSRRDTSVGIRMRLPMRAMRGRDIHVEVRLLGEAEGYSPAIAELIRGVPADTSREGLSDGVLDAGEDPLVPGAFMSHPGYPNPFNPTTEIRFELPEPSTVSLAVFDLLGRKVADLAEGEYEAGYHTATWNAAGAASGVYLARFTATSAAGGVAYTRTHKLVLMK